MSWTAIHLQLNCPGLLYFWIVSFSLNIYFNIVSSLLPCLQGHFGVHNSWEFSLSHPLDIMWSSLDLHPIVSIVLLYYCIYCTVICLRNAHFSLACHLAIIHTFFSFTAYSGVFLTSF